MKSFSRFLLTPLLAISSTAGVFAADASAADAPVKLVISVDPKAVAAGASASATIRLIPKSGIKLNKYPKIKLQIPAAAGLIDAAEGSMGNAAPPAADNLDANYYHGEVDPLTVTFHVDAGAVPGRHEIEGKLSYFYCVAASGYCAPAKVAVAIPVTVR